MNILKFHQKINHNFVIFSVNKNVLENKEEYEKKMKLIGKKRFCTCNKSKCINKYCKCLSEGENCNPEVCSCNKCHNVSPLYLNKIKNYLKIGICCSCKKTKCNKKYCECYNAGKKCNICCSCMNCENKKINLINNSHFIFDSKLKQLNIGSK